MSKAECLFSNLEYKALKPLNECEPETSRPIVNQILYENTFLLLHGFKETLKSWLAAYLAICVAVGVDFFGFKVLKPGIAVYVYGEGKMIRRLHSICRGLDIEFPSNLIPYRLRADLSKSELTSDLKRHIPKGTRLVVIDNYEKFW